MPYYRCPACGSLSHSVASYSTAGVCAICSAELPYAARLPALPEPLFTMSRRVPADTAAPAKARAAIGRLPFEREVRNRLALLVSELMTNSIRHAGLSQDDLVELELIGENGQVWVAVRDGGPGFDPDPPEANGNGRYGLTLVAKLSNDWGVDRGPDGCTVWCAMGT